MARDDGSLRVLVSRNSLVWPEAEADPSLYRPYVETIELDVLRAVARLASAPVTTASGG